MDIKATNLARAKIYQFLSTLYRDEIPLWLIEKMGEEPFLTQIKKLQEVCTIQDFCSGLGRMRGTIESAKAADTYNELRYEYADLFLNAGNNPAFPYESCYATREPLGSCRNRLLRYERY